MNNKIKKELKKIEIPTELHERAKLGVIKAKSDKPKRKLKRLAIPLVASAFLVFSAGVGAAYIPSFNNMLAIVSPEIALMLQPIEISDENKGIKMEVVAAMNDNEMAVVYVTLQDLTGDRVDETLDLYDYSLSGAHMHNSKVVDFDETTNTATLRIQANGGENLNDKKVNFHISSFLSDKRRFEPKINANLSEIISIPSNTIPLDMNNIPGGGGDLFLKLKDQGIIQVLKPNDMNIQLPEVDFMNISNWGLVDDRLHIQVRWIGDDIDNHGQFYFIDDLGNEIRPSSISYGIDEVGHTNYGHEYTEFIFDKDSVDFKEQELLGEFVSNGNYTIGSWSTTFEIKSAQKEINRDFKKDFGTWSAKTISISPLGITLYGNGKFNESQNIEVSAKMNDNSVQVFDSMFTFNDNEEIIAKFVSSLPLDPSQVKKIKINDTEIDF